MRVFLVAATLLSSVALMATPAEPSTGQSGGRQAPPGTTPMLFAPDVVSSAFSTDALRPAKSGQER